VLSMRRCVPVQGNAQTAGQSSGWLTARGQILIKNTTPQSAPVRSIDPFSLNRKRPDIKIREKSDIMSIAGKSHQHETKQE